MLIYRRNEAKNGVFEDFNASVYMVFNKFGIEVTQYSLRYRLDTAHPTLILRS